MTTCEDLTWDTTNLPTKVKCSAMLWLHVFTVFSAIDGSVGLFVKIYERHPFRSTCVRSDNKIYTDCMAVGATLTIPASDLWSNDAVEHTVKLMSWTDGGSAVLRVCADLPEPPEPPDPEEPEPEPEPEPQPGTPTPGTPAPIPPPEEQPVGPEPDEPPKEVLIVSEGDYFEFNNDTWQVLHIVCGPHGNHFVTIADSAAQIAAIPKVGDTITFTVDVDWHGGNPRFTKWYSMTPENGCFADYPAPVQFVRGALDSSPTHMFTEEADAGIAFLRVLAQNTENAATTLGDDGSQIFNLWQTPSGFRPGWLVAAFMAFALPGFAEKTEYFGDLVFDGTPEPQASGFSLSLAAAAFVGWIAEAAAAVAEDICDLIFGTPEVEETGGFSIFWSAAEFVSWLYKSIAAMVEDILDLVFGED